ncbi:MAG: N-acetylneuraminate synthase [Eubacterium sp.]|nr:N-acetylneuraminate synthase [Eubacterium sp.]
MKTLIIAEAGVNHNGNLDLALKLCDEAKRAGADVVKFQTWKTENMITRNVGQADYQKKNTGSKKSQYDMLKELELAYQDFEKIKTYCDSIAIQFASTADDPESLDFLVDLGVPFLKIGSGDLNNIPYLRHIGQKHLPVILSTGMGSLSDVDVSLSTLQESGAGNITLLHCTTNYPCPYKDVNLNAMKTLREAFHLPVGYSDHTLGIEIPIAAAAMGAVVIEKHFTLDRTMEGPDHAASIQPDELMQMVQCIRNVECALGNGLKKPTQEEKSISKVVVKRIVAAKEIEKGQVFTEKNLTVKRNDKGMPATCWDFIIGKKAQQRYLENQEIVFYKE